MKYSLHKISQISKHKETEKYKALSIVFSVTYGGTVIKLGNAKLGGLLERAVYNLKMSQ